MLTVSGIQRCPNPELALPLPPDFRPTLRSKFCSPSLTYGHPLIPMKKLLTPALLLLTFICAPAKDRVPEPVSTVNFRGEELPVYAQPRLILPKKSVAPQYPAAERKEAAEGKVMLTVLVGTDGKVSEVEIVSSTPKPSFGTAARTAVLQWTYKPLTLNGKATKFIVQQPITFNFVEGAPEISNWNSM